MTLTKEEAEMVRDHLSEKASLYGASFGLTSKKAGLFQIVVIASSVMSETHLLEIIADAQDFASASFDKELDQGDFVARNVGTVELH